MNPVIKISAATNKFYVKYASDKKLYLLIFFLAAIQLFLKTNSEYLSPWDEMYHLSYVQYVFNGHLPRIGDPLNTWARDGFSCHPVWPFGITTPIECGQIAEPKMYPEGGTNSAAIWPPVYYVIVALCLKVVTPIGVAPLFAAKYVTVLLWSLGIVVLSIYLRKVKVARSITLSFALAIASLPFAMFHGAFITPHSMVPLVCGILMFAAHPFLFNNMYSVHTVSKLTAASLIAIMTVPHSIAGIEIVLLSIFISAIDSRENFFRSAALLMIASISIAVTKLWSEIQNLRSIPWDSTVNTSESQGAENAVTQDFNKHDVFDSLWRFFPHSIDGYQFQGLTSLGISQMFAFILIGGVFAAIFVSSNRYLKALGISTVISGVTFSIYLEKILEVPVSARYGLSVIIIGLALVPMTIKGALGRNLFLMICVGTYVVMLGAKPFMS